MKPLKNLLTILLILLPLSAYAWGVVVSSGGVAAGGTEILRPSGDGWYYAWTASTGSDYTCVDESVTDDADYVSSTADFQLESFAFADTSTSSGKTITKVTLKWRDKYDTTAENTRVGIHADQYGDDEFSAPIATGGSWGEHSYEMAVNPHGGGSWTSANIDAYQFSLADRGSGGNISVSQIWLEVTYGD